MLSIGFQSTHAHGVRQIRDMYYLTFICFNPRTHTACDFIFFSRFIFIKSFNPRTHTACDSIYFVYFFKRHCFNPRTHTACDVRFYYRYRRRLVSIHARTRRATRKMQDYNSKYLVSIHARTRRATMDAEGTIIFADVSIHARTRRATSECFTIKFTKTVFQSTHAHGVRHGFQYWLDAEDISFNPRTHTACDLKNMLR